MTFSQNTIGTYVNSDPKFSKRKIYNNAVRYEIPTDENGTIITYI